MSSENDMLSFEGENYYQLFDMLIEAAGKEWQEYPQIKLNGKLEGLHKAAGIILKNLGDEELIPRHQEMIDAKFLKKQHGYGRTAYNLAHRAHQIHAVNERRRHFNQETAA